MGTAAPQPWTGAGPESPVVRTLRVVGAVTRPRGAAPRGPACPAGSPFLPRNGEKEGRGFAPGPRFHGRSFPLAGFWDRCIWYGGGAITTDILKPIWDAFSSKKYAKKAFLRKNVSAPLRLPPKPSPRGEGAPVRTLGRMRGRSTPPTGREKESVGATGRFFYKERLGTGSPPHQSPSVPASPQGEASGLCSPTRKSVPNQGTYMGTVIVPRPEQCGTIAKTSECQRAGYKPGGAGGHPPATLCVRAFSRESLDPPPGTGREPTSQGLTCEGLSGTTCRRQRSPPPGRRGPRGAAPQGGFGATHPKGT